MQSERSYVLTAVPHARTVADVGFTITSCLDGRRAPDWSPRRASVERSPMRHSHGARAVRRGSRRARNRARAARRRFNHMANETRPRRRRGGASRHGSRCGGRRLASSITHGSGSRSPRSRQQRLGVASLRRPTPISTTRSCVEASSPDYDPQRGVIAHVRVFSQRDRRRVPT
jgi:hypothetical protein